MESTLLNAGDIVKMSITSLSNEGKGLGRYAGMAVFVRNALPGEEVAAKITKLMKTYAEAELVEIIVASEHRVKSPCKAFGKCGACSLMHLNYDSQLEWKRKFVSDAIERIGGLKDIKVDPVIGMSNGFHYRNKSAFPFGMKDGRVVFGCFEEKSHRLIPLNDCLIQNDVSISAMRILCKWANDFGIEAYDEETGRGLIRHGVIRTTTGGTIVALVTGKDCLTYKSELIKRLKEGIPTLESVVNNINPGRTSLIMGRRNDVLFGNGIIRDTLGELVFDVNIESFLQVNPAQTLRLYNIALDGLNLSKADRLIDLYCGIGTISLTAAQRVAGVIGIETVPSAVSNAKHNAVLNGIDNAEFLCGDVEAVLPKLLGKGGKKGFHATALILDPPRKGVHKTALNAIASSGIKKLAYVSCNPSTLARDLKELVAAGYRIDSVTPVDMFPMTHHVETVVLLSRETNPLTVEVRMEVETGEVKEHPTYKRIQEYVQEKYGFKVHTAYIAEVKRMVGLDMHKAPNAVEQRKHEYHPCPPEKVEAIKDALRHFGLVSE